MTSDLDKNLYMYLILPHLSLTESNKVTTDLASS